MTRSDSGDEQAAVGSLVRLGLTRTEARLLLGLARLGSATARELADATDVPRSQVYGTAEELEELGLLHVQHATPREYHATAPEEIESILRSRLERDLETVVDRLEELERSQSHDAETREEIWTVRGREAIDGRIAQLIGGAERRIVLGVRNERFLPDRHVQLLAERDDAGIDVLVISSDRQTLDRFADVDGVTAIEPPETMSEEDHAARLLVVDDGNVLHSVLVPDPGDDGEETAFWSSDSGFARTLVSLVEQSLSETSEE
ncbi:Sugar-specific transcriptional regulator TrmB [Halalkaliarchaeum sp. AArc-CO]|uniref:TrmB family transcriptional regulator n=1 Tax=unclassified Halalkaliarchaeum TaxID=2678344 RepID=UPI00217CDFB1|nr:MULTISPECIES: helix-turn-helix domain-containing protein [unclassified Halalkaliarchaeum]MDR5674391.1 helix-turn-helix domain-containing protein [Halalkaliarchaeum sp. AArc-GB]UWG52206.1 Sugar-specific transcriptional regulator TrmB [Halalkaliarchaeum sp. AArc-CO]